jgi:hypothetical protein
MLSQLFIYLFVPWPYYNLFLCSFTLLLSIPNLLVPSTLQYILLTTYSEIVPWPYYSTIHSHVPSFCCYSVFIPRLLVPSTFQYCLPIIYSTCSMTLLQLIHLFLNLYLYCLPIIYSTCSMTLLQLNHLFLHFSVLLISYLQYLFHELTTTHPLVP